MTTVYKYRIWCNDDSQYEEVWAETEPTTCPTNTGHTIDQTKTVIIEINEPDQVTIKEENTPTGGNIQVKTRKFTIPATVGEHVFDHSEPIGVNILNVFFSVGNSHKGDILEVCISPDTVIGAISEAVSVSDTVINVQSTVTDNIQVGYFVSLTDGTNTDDLGRCLAVDADAGTITVETATVNSFSPLTPTYVRMSVKQINEFYLETPGLYRLGSDKIGSSYIPANTTVRIQYTNNDGVAKTFVLGSELLY